MNSFKDFGITSINNGFTGDKIKIERILNRQIVVEDYKIENSNFTGKRLTLQIVLDNTKRVIFTGSVNLMDMIQKVDKTKMPFLTTIIKNDNERYQFT